MAVLLKTISSDTWLDVTYELAVTTHGNVRCSCPAFKFGKGKPCKHIIAWKNRTPTWKKHVAKAKAKANA